MQVMTQSGPVKINRRTPYGKWLLGYTSTDAWSGAYTLERMWRMYHDKKPKGCSWHSWGVICGKILYVHV